MRIPARSPWSGWLGVGPVVFPRYAGGSATEVLPLPLPSIVYDDTLFVDMKRAGGYVWANEDHTLGLALAGEIRWGWRARDAQRLAGMMKRRSSIEGGPSLEWDGGGIEAAVTYKHDLTGAARGSALRVSVGKDLIDTHGFKLAALIAAERLDARTNQYYFGVRPVEATAMRPSYQPSAGTDAIVGIDASYALDSRHLVVFGGSITRLNASAAHSPIVAKRDAAWGWIGYAWTLGTP